MAKVKLTYTEKGKKPRSEMFRCMGDAMEHLVKLERALTIISAELNKVEKPVSALESLGRSAGK